MILFASIHTTGQSGSLIFFKTTYHDESASLSQCPAGLVMFLRPDFTTKRHHFITNPVGTSNASFDMSF